MRRPQLVERPCRDEDGCVMMDAGSFQCRIKIGALFAQNMPKICYERLWEKWRELGDMDGRKF